MYFQGLHGLWILKLPDFSILISKISSATLSVSHMNVLETSSNSYKHQSTQKYSKIIKKIWNKKSIWDLFKNVAQQTEHKPIKNSRTDFFKILVLKLVIFQKNVKILLFLLISLTFPWVFHVTLNSLTFPCFPEGINPDFVWNATDSGISMYWLITDH
jgi:hypothetical protein